MDIGTRMTQLVLTEREYEDIVGSVAHMAHNAWPTESKRPVFVLEVHFQAILNLIDLSNAAAMPPRRQSSIRIRFHLRLPLP